MAYDLLSQSPLEREPKRPIAANLQVRMVTARKELVGV
jgi:hypothetical protein